MFPDYKIAHSKDSECTVLLDVFSPTDAMHVKYPLSPIEIYATKEEVTMYNYQSAILDGRNSIYDGNGETRVPRESRVAKH